MLTREINVTRKDGTHHIILLDNEDFELYGEYKWYVCKHDRTFYANRDIYIDTRRSSERLHRVVLGLVPGDGLIADHIDHNGLNNTRSNLRIANPSESQWNTRRKCTGSSRYKGVNLDGYTNRWLARIASHGKQLNLGRFDSEYEAAIAYDAAARELHGNNACLNFP